MGRLKSLTPRLQTLGSRLSPAVTAPVDRKEAEAQRMKRRDREVDWRKWYGLAKWKALRKEAWKRDSWTCCKTGIICLGAYPAGNSPVADHITPHHGDPALFWDINNIQTVSKEYHDREKQRQERTGQW